MILLSLRSRLTIWYSIILTIALSLFGAFMYLYLEHNLMQEIDVSLRNKAVEVFKSIKIIDSSPFPLQKVILPDVNMSIWK